MDEEDLVFLRAVAAQSRSPSNVSSRTNAKRAPRPGRSTAGRGDEAEHRDFSEPGVRCAGRGRQRAHRRRRGRRVRPERRWTGLEHLDSSPAVEPERHVKYDLLPTDSATPVAHAVREATTLWLQEREDLGAVTLVAADGAAMGWPVIAVVPLLRGDRTRHGTRRAVRPLPAAVPLGGRGPAVPDHPGCSRVSRPQPGHPHGGGEARHRGAGPQRAAHARLAEAGACGVLEATDTHIVKANGFLLDMLGYDELPPGGLDWRAVTPPGWEEVGAQPPWRTSGLAGSPSRSRRSTCAPTEHQVPVLFERGHLPHRPVLRSRRRHRPDRASGSSRRTTVDRSPRGNA